MSCPGCGRALINTESGCCPSCGTRIATQQNPYSAGGAPKGDGRAVASLVLGLVGLIAWFLPIIGVPVTVSGLVLGILSLNGPKRTFAIVGLVLCIIGLIASMVNGALGAYLAVRDYLN